MKEVYIIEKDGNVNYYKMLNDNDFHSAYFFKYIQENNLNIKCDNLTSFGYATELSKLGLASIIVENKNMYIFLPEYISNNQFTWFLKSKKSFRYFQLSYGYIDNKEFVSIDPDITQGETTKIKDFYKYLKKNIQNRKEGEVNEHRRTIK